MTPPLPPLHATPDALKRALAAARAAPPPHRWQALALRPTPQAQPRLHVARRLGVRRPTVGRGRAAYPPGGHAAAAQGHLSQLADGVGAPGSGNRDDRPEGPWQRSPGASAGGARDEGGPGLAAVPSRTPSPRAPGASGERATGVGVAAPDRRVRSAGGPHHATVGPSDAPIPPLLSVPWPGASGPMFLAIGYKPWMTLLRGRVLLNQGKLEQQPGYGQFLPAGSPLPPIGGRVK
jgi:hypothetical protein